MILSMMRLAEIRQLVKTDALAAFEGAVDRLQALVHRAADRDREQPARRFQLSACGLDVPFVEIRRDEEPVG